VSRDFRTVPEQISEIRKRYPQSIALAYGQQQLNYSELDDRAHQFSACLVQLGVVPGDTVALCMERSFDWIIAALAIMRAGAAYVPLDITWPDSRLRFALCDSGATLVVARAKAIARLQTSIPAVDPHSDFPAIPSASVETFAPVQSGDLAYVIYTSGTSGEPKGVEITRGNLANLIRWHIDTFGVTRKDRASHLLSLGFDAAVLEIWGHLCAGATLCLTEDTVRSSPELLQDWIVRDQISIALVPSIMAARLIQMEWPKTTTLRLLVAGGDTLHRAPAVQLPFQLVNHYGPTECTVVSSWAPVECGSSGTPPIGTPIAGANIHLLDEIGRCVPDGTVGEIYISGRGVGQGYRNRPDLTGRFFLPDPFSSEPGKKMYRTGDRAIRLPNGALEFRGRPDRQTKIRGYRVELDEVSSILSRHPSIEFSTVTTHCVGEDAQLIAYVLPKNGVTAPDKATLQHYLLSTLPDYMVPCTFVRLRTLPLSGNGKLDFSMLPSPTAAELVGESPAKSPISGLEERLLSIVRWVLSNDSVTVEDSFFLSGGHSLLAMQLLTQLRNTLGIDLTLNQLLEAPSVRGLAELVQSVSSVSANQGTGGVFWVQSSAIELTKALGDNATLFSIPLTQDDFNLCGTHPSFREIARRLKCKIEEIQPEGPYTVGGLCLGGILAYEIASQMRSSGQAVRLVVLLNAPNPIYSQGCGSLVGLIAYMRYIVKRAMQIGPRMTLSYGLARLKWTIRGQLRVRTTPHEFARAAATIYDPPKFDGDVLLIESAQRPPNLDMVSAWQSVVTGRLYVSSIDAHWREILSGTHVYEVADTIVSHLIRRESISNGCVDVNNSGTCRLSSSDKSASSICLAQQDVKLQ
jgi:amino acid adenylation domain-containing protein